jgi:hypothetical protein
VLDVPGFWRPVAARTGEIVERDGLVYCDLVPADGEVPPYSSTEA